MAIVISCEVPLLEYVGCIFKKEFVIKPKLEYIKKIELIPKSIVKNPPGKLEVIFHMENITEEIVEVSYEYLNSILDFISFKYSISFGEPRRTDPRTYYFNVENIITIGFTEEQIVGMEAKLKEPNRNEYLRIYRAALQNINPIAKFMFLYSLLLEIVTKYTNNKSQSKVDDFIKKCPEYKNEEDQFSTKDSRKKETVYTWLRNQVGHTSSKGNITSVRVAIESKVNELSQIVRRAIEQEINKI